MRLSDPPTPIDARKLRLYLLPFARRWQRGAGLCIAARGRGHRQFIWGINAASGHCSSKYFFGISDCMALTINRAGIKVFLEK